jgi:hypothetical protein
MTSAIQLDTIQSSSGGRVVINAPVGSGAVLATTVIRNSTRTAISALYNTAHFSGSFTKTTSTSNLVVVGTVFGGQYNDGNGALGFVLDGTTWDFGAAYNYDGVWTKVYTTIQCFGQGYFQNISAGSHTMGWGVKAFNGATTRPYETLNPNGSDDGRNGQFISTLIIYETA